MKIDQDTAAIVTGGASGLGEATARLLSASGAKVALLDMNAERGAALAAELGCVFCRTDVTDEASVDAALAEARAANGQERIAVNCAGIAIGAKTASRKRDSGEVVHHAIDDFIRVIRVNLIGTFQVMAKSAAGMLSLDPVTPDGGRGVIVNTSSVAGVEGQIGQVAYSASKAGVAGMTLPVARDLSRDGVRVCAIMPGLFHTPMFDTLPQEAQDALGASVPFPSRLGKPDEFAQLVGHIVANDMLNGETIRLDGAVRLAPK
jgi:NAD(P)-dependent dehydrogenase (short-subunit alcohol dehydrogenase family)